MPKRVDKKKNYPYISNYPVLWNWLEKHEARCAWQLPNPPKPEDAPRDWMPHAYIEAWQVGQGIAIIQVYANQHGWDIFTPCGTNKVAETFADAEKRLGIGEKVASKKCVKCDAEIEEPVLAADEDERCDYCADPE